MLNKKINLSTNIFGQDIKKGLIRDGFGNGLLKAGEKNEQVVALTADLTESTKVDKFAKKFPERFFNAGVAEQGMITVAAGLANYGKLPFAASYACFSPGRNFEQIRTTIAINNLPVRIVGSHAGVNTGPDGATHQMLEDVAMMRSLPNMTVVCPSDVLEAEKLVIESLKIKGPVYLRLPRYESAIYTTTDTPCEIGKAIKIWESNNPQVAIFATGPLVYEAILAAKDLEEMGIGTVVVNMHTVKPLDEEILMEEVMKTKAVVTVEDHQIAGGLGSAIAEFLGRSYPVPLEFVGVDDKFGESGKPDELLEKFGLKTRNIIEKVNKALSRKR